MQRFKASYKRTQTTCGNHCSNSISIVVRMIIYGKVLTQRFTDNMA